MSISLSSCISRTIKKIQLASQTPKWGGFVRLIETDYSELDPFIFLVHHQHTFKKGERTGFPPHPHRGFETVTYCLEGGFEHGDSVGNKGIYGNGDVQWLTTGKGVLHSEMFITSKEKESSFNGFQLWLNLPKKLKMCEPNYQMLWKYEIPIILLNGDKITIKNGNINGINEKNNMSINSISTGGNIEIKIIAGRINNIQSIIEKSIPLSYFHIKMEPNTKWMFEINKNHHCFVYILEGEGEFGKNKKKVTKYQYSIFENDGDLIEIYNSSNNQILDFLFLEGQPFNEPFFHQGPFVMSSKEELMQTFIDYQMGKFGKMDDFQE